MNESNVAVAEPVVDHTSVVVNSDAAIWNRAVALNLTLGRFGTQRKTDAEVTIDEGADQEMFTAHKCILDSPELKKVTQFDGKLRNNLRKYVLPHLFKDGIYLVPNGLLPTVYDYLTAQKAERTQLVDALVAAYKQRVNEAKVKLGSEWRRTDYPHEDKLRKLFVFDFKIISFGVPEQLKEIQASIYEREKEKAEATWQETGDVVRQALRVAFKKLIDHAIEKLTPEEDGKKRIFRDATIANVTDFFKEFKSKNIVDDDALASLVDKAKDVLHGVDPDDLRTDDKLRESVLTNMSEIKGVLDNSLIVYGGRKYIED